MRVLAIAQSGTLGGAERTLLRLARRLPEHGIHVEIASPEGPLQDAARHDGVPVHTGDVGPITPENAARSALRLPAWRRLAANVKPDVHLLNGIVAHRAVPALRNAPRVPWLHEVVEHPPLAWRSRRFWRSVPVVLCGAPNVARAATANGVPQDLVRVVGAPVELVDPAPRPAWADGRPVVGFVGRLDEAKGPLDLFAAVPHLPDEVRVVMAGAGDADHDLGERVIQLGPVAAASALMPWFDVLVMPSRREGFGLAAAEALAAGTPVVVTTEVGLSELVDVGHVVPPGDPAALASAIRQALSDPKVPSVAAYEADRVAANVAALLREAVGR